MAERAVYLPTLSPVVFNEDDDKSLEASRLLGSTSKAVPNENNFPPAQKLYKRRWLILLCYCFLTISCGSGYFVFSAVSSTTQQYYGVSLTAVNILTVSYESMSLFLALPFGFLADKMGLGFMLVLASFLDASGAIIRFFGKDSNGYWLLVFGSLVRSCSMAGFMFLPPRIASVWFGHEERGLATGIAVAMDGVGMALGLVQGSGMVHQHDDKNLVAKEFEWFLLTQAISACVVFIYIVIVARNAPPTPPSLSQLVANQINRDFSIHENTDEVNVVTPGPVVSNSKNSEIVELKRMSYGREIMSLMRHRQFMIILSLHAIVYIMETLILTLLNELLTPKFPKQDLLIGVMGATAVLGSTVGNICIGPLVDKTKHYVRWSWGIFGSSTIFTVIFTILFFTWDNFAALFISLFIMETTSASFYTLAFDLAAEATYPIPESSSGMILIVSGQVFGVWVTVITSQLFSSFGAGSVLGIFCTLNFSSIFLLLFMKEATLRTDIDKGTVGKGNLVLASQNHYYGT